VLVPLTIKEKLKQDTFMCGKLIETKQCWWFMWTAF